MRNAKLLVTPRDVDAVGASTLTPQRVRDRLIQEMYFRVPLEAGKGIVQGGPTVVDAATYGFTFEDIPAGVVTALRVGEGLRDLWPRTLIRVNVWYTSPVGSTNLFTFGIRLRQVAVGQLLSAPTVVVNQNWTAPGPAVANTALFTTFVASAVTLPAAAMCNLTLVRIGPDANANALRFIRADFIFQEVA